jgi:hypothetical protein
MKVIQIFALAIVMAATVMAQSTAQGNAGGVQQSSPSPTPKPAAKASPAHTKPGAGSGAAPSKAGVAKTSPAPGTKAAAGKTGQASTTKAPAGAKSAAADKKPAVQTGVLPEKKKKTGAQKSAAAGTQAADKGTKTGTPAAPAAAKKPATPAKSGAANAAPGKNLTPAAAGAGKAKTPAKSATAVSPNPKDKMKSTAPAARAKIAAAPPAAKVTATAPATVPEKKPLPRLIGSAGRRDPFISPIRNAGAISPSQSCTSGKRCLNIPELVLQGTVRDISGKMMAVVSTANHTRTYTLRENDQVFNGSVEKITSDSIIFREYVKDTLGRESAKEVVKKMGPTS